MKKNLPRLLCWILSRNALLRNAMVSVICGQDIKEFDLAALATIRNNLGSTAHLLDLYEKRDNNLFIDKKKNEHVEKTIKKVSDMITQIREDPKKPLL